MGLTVESRETRTDVSGKITISSYSCFMIVRLMVAFTVLGHETKTLANVSICTTSIQIAVNVMIES